MVRMQLGLQTLTFCDDISTFLQHSKKQNIFFIQTQILSTTPIDRDDIAKQSIMFLCSGYFRLTKQIIMVKCCRGMVKGAICIYQHSTSPRTEKRHTFLYTVILKFCTMVIQNKGHNQHHLQNTKDKYYVNQSN